MRMASQSTSINQNDVSSILPMDNLNLMWSDVETQEFTRFWTAGPPKKDPTVAITRCNYLCIR